MADKLYYPRLLFWFRRDLRHIDNAGLYYALQASPQVYTIFVFDRAILAPLKPEDRRVEFIWQSLAELKQHLVAQGSDLIVVDGQAKQLIPQWAVKLGVQAVFCNEDYEPSVIARDRYVCQQLAEQGIAWRDYKDQVVFAKDEILSQSHKPFTVFTPYQRSWLKALNATAISGYPSEEHLQHLAKVSVVSQLPSLNALGFKPTNLHQLGLMGGMSAAQRFVDDFSKRIEHYAQQRDFPALRGGSYLSVHNRFGTIAIRQLVDLAQRYGSSGANTWLSELIWREFYFQILYHFPQVVNSAFKPAYNALAWRNNEAEFKAWCTGNTGYPLVDAAIQQLLHSGFMHNRLRMLSASFLSKHLLIDWRWGEGFFAEHLNDFDLAANNGGWQWAASTGCDAQPYFRVFNPITQSKKFDSQAKFIRRYLPQLARVPDAYIHTPWLMPAQEQRHNSCVIGHDYPLPIVEHHHARQRALAAFKAVKLSAYKNIF